MGNKMSREQKPEILPDSVHVPNSNQHLEQGQNQSLNLSQLDRTFNSSVSLGLKNTSNNNISVPELKGENSTLESTDQDSISFSFPQLVVHGSRSELSRSGQNTVFELDEQNVIREVSVQNIFPELIIQHFEAELSAENAVFEIEEEKNVIPKVSGQKIFPELAVQQSASESELSGQNAVLEMEGRNLIPEVSGKNMIPELTAQYYGPNLSGQNTVFKLDGKNFNPEVTGQNTIPELTAQYSCSGLSGQNTIFELEGQNAITEASGKNISPELAIQHFSSEIGSQNTHFKLNGRNIIPEISGQSLFPELTVQDSFPEMNIQPPVYKFEEPNLIPESNELNFVEVTEQNLLPEFNNQESLSEQNEQNLQNSIYLDGRNSVLDLGRQNLADMNVQNQIHESDQQPSCVEMCGQNCLANVYDENPIDSFCNASSNLNNVVPNPISTSQNLTAGINFQQSVNLSDIPSLDLNIHDLALTMVPIDLVQPEVGHANCEIEPTETAGNTSSNHFELFIPAYQRNLTTNDVVPQIAVPKMDENTVAEMQPEELSIAVTGTNPAPDFTSSNADTNDTELCKTNSFQTKTSSSADCWESPYNTPDRMLEDIKEYNIKMNTTVSDHEIFEQHSNGLTGKDSESFTHNLEEHVVSSSSQMSIDEVREWAMDLDVDVEENSSMDIIQKQIINKMITNSIDPVLNETEIHRFRYLSTGENHSDFPLTLDVHNHEMMNTANIEEGVNKRKIDDIEAEESQPKRLALDDNDEELIDKEIEVITLRR